MELVAPISAFFESIQTNSDCLYGALLPQGSRCSNRRNEFGLTLGAAVVTRQ